MKLLIVHVFKILIDMFQGNLSTEEIELWGHEYVRHLAGEVVQEYNSLTIEQG